VRDNLAANEKQVKFANEKNCKVTYLGSISSEEFFAGRGVANSKLSESSDGYSSVMV